MATKVKVELSKGEGEFANIELSGQTNYTYGNGENEFSVGYWMLNLTRFKHSHADGLQENTGNRQDNASGWGCQCFCGSWQG